MKIWWSPASKVEWSLQSRAAAAAVRIGEPLAPMRCETSANASRPFGRSRDEKYRESGSCSALRMLTANTPLVVMWSAPSDPLITHTRISGGSSDTDENALAVMP